MNKKNLILSIAAILILTLLTVCLLFFWLNLKSEQKQQLQYNQSQWQNLTAEVQQQSLALITLQNKLNRIVDSRNQTLNQQIIKESADLIGLAELYLQMDGDVHNALKSLKIAEYHLQTLADPTLLAVQTSLANDLKHLQAIATPNPADLLLQLQAVSESIQHLDLIPSRLPAPPGQASATTAPWYQRMLNSLANSFKGLVAVHYQPAKDLTIIAPEQRGLLLENINFAVMKIEWAVMQQQNILYHQGLSQVKQWINEYFVDNAERAQVLAQMKNLDEANLHPPTVELTQSLQALKTELENKQEHISAPATPNSAPPNPINTTPSPTAPSTSTPASPTQGIEI